MEVVIKIEPKQYTVILDGVIFDFPGAQYDNLVDMLCYCADLSPGVLVKRDLSNYRKIERPT